MLKDLLSIPSPNELGGNENALAIAGFQSSAAPKAPNSVFSKPGAALFQPAPIFTSSLWFNGRERGFAMAKAVAVCALCIVSAVVGAGIDHYSGAMIEQGAPHLQQAVSPKAAVAATAEMNVEVLGDRVRCDVRYQELKIPPDEYQPFKRKCMGANWDAD
jgi:hypothetical protein